MINIKKFVINLENRPKRLIHTLKELKKVNLSKEVTRIEACNKKNAEKLKFNFINKEIKNNIKNTNNTFMIHNYNALACAISHISTWQYIIDINISFLIIEDDIKINNVNQFNYDYNDLIDLIKNIKYNKVCLSI